MFIARHNRTTNNQLLHGVPCQLPTSVRLPTNMFSLPQKFLRSVSKTNPKLVVTQAKYRLDLIPYTSNPDFVRRSGILNQLKDQLGHTQETTGTSQARVSLYGLGGTG